LSHTARLLPVEKRDVFLQRVGAVLVQREQIDDDALRGMVQSTAVG